MLQACFEHGFFYLVNHGVEEELFTSVIDESREFFSLSLDEKMKLAHKEHRGYTPLYSELLDPSATSKGFKHVTHLFSAYGTLKG